MISFSTLIVGVIASAFKMSQKNNPPLSFAALEKNGVQFFLGEELNSILPWWITSSGNGDPL
jgi:hypothetical protein